MTAAPKGKKRPRRPVYLVVARAGDVARETGVLVPLTVWDQRQLKARKLGVGTEIRAELKQRRNVKFHRLAHAIGALCAEQLEDFAGMDAHAVLKKVQEDADIFCDKTFIDASPVIKTVVSVARGMLGDAVGDTLAKALSIVKKIALKEPRSLAFDEMDESEFQEFVARAFKHLRDRYWPSMTEEHVALMAEMYEERH